MSAPSQELPPLQNEPIRAPKLDPSLASLKPKSAASQQAKVPTPAPTATTPVSSNGAPKPVQNDVFTLALMDVAAFWSEKGRNELANLYRHSLDIPMSTLEGALKSGKLHFQWREVRPWLRLAAGNTMPTLPDDLAIELPIAVIAPRFIEQRVNGKPKRKVQVGDDIPDVFEQKTPPPSAAPTTPSAPALGATAVSMDLAAALGTSSKTGDTAFLVATGGKTLLEYGEIFGQPEKKNWTLAEVTQKTMTLRGVAGAIIGSTDGLLVAGSWPNGVKGDAVAAFLPQIYGRIIQYTKELKLGEPGNLTLMIENVPLQIFKAGSSFFTVIGRAGENLPKAQLNAIATRLSINFSGK
jgi:predicted regulator of Ras-like GTPase activity (Roadblock/LC7/MglB family)